MGGKRNIARETGEKKGGIRKMFTEYVLTEASFPGMMKAIK